MWDCEVRCWLLLVLFHHPDKLDGFAKRKRSHSTIESNKEQGLTLKEYLNRKLQELTDGGNKPQKKRVSTIIYVEYENGFENCIVVQDSVSMLISTCVCKIHESNIQQLDDHATNNVPN